MHRNIRQCQTPFSSGKTQNHETLRILLYMTTIYLPIYLRGVHWDLTQRLMNVRLTIHVNILITLCQ